jgi:predicted DNA-binding protein (MmcQ/YjbR family)
MNHDELRAYCLRKPGSSADFPFDETTLTLRVMGKIFALTDIASQPVAVNLKCDPDWAIILRQTYDAVQPGYHMNKRHWNTVTLDGSIPIDEVNEMIDHSYRLVAKGLKKADREQLAALAVSESEQFGR